jgi:hypothetical protein
MEHEVVSKGRCVACALERKRYWDIDLLDPSILVVKSAEVLINAIQRTLHKMEVAYLDPQYSLCNHRLMREFQELMNFMQTSREQEKCDYNSLSTEALCGTSQKAKVPKSCPDEGELEKNKKEKEQLIKDMSILDEKSNGTVHTKTFSYIIKLFKKMFT